jgi:hypothetical protein
MADGFSVTFIGEWEQEPTQFPGTVHFRILDSGVLVIMDGDEVRRFSPHAWREVRGGGGGDASGGEPGSVIAF